MNTKTRLAGRHDFSELGVMLEERIDHLVDGIEKRAIVELPSEWAIERPELRGPVHEATRTSVLAEIDALKNDRALPESCPQADAHFARFLAQIGAPLSGMLWGFRAGHRVQWGCWNEIVQGLDVSEAERRELLNLGSDFFFAYADRLCDFVTDEYTEERDRLLRGREQRRAQIVHELLAGREVDTEALDYDVDGAHLAVIAWGPGAADVARELVTATDRRLLPLSLPDNDTWWAWLGGAKPLNKQAKAAIDRVEPPDGTSVALGDEQLGREGFRRSHQQAGYAHRASLASGRAVTRYRDVALEALAARDEAEARAFVGRELSGLDGNDKRSLALRETLVAYFASGHNAAASAAVLHVHEQTVANRLAAVEERIGSRVNARRAELETALRLRAFLASDNDSR